MDVFAAMAGRRSIKRFSPRPVELDKILQVIQAGGLAPSSGNLQNWRFVIVTDLDVIRGMYDHTLNQEPFLSAMAAIVVCGDVNQAHMMYGMRGKRLYTIQNCAACVQNMLLATYALDMGSIWIGAFDEDKISDLLGIPAHEHRPQAIILLGYPEYEPEPKDIKPLQDLVFFNRFGNKVQRPHLITYDWALEWRMQAQKYKSHMRYGRSILPGKKPAPAAQGGGQQGGGPQGGAPHGAPAAKPRSGMKQRWRDMIDGLKKDEYRQK